MSNWQEKFQDTATNVAFHLTLSRRMILALEMAREYSEGRCGRATEAMQKFGYFIPSVRSLIERGLVEHHDRPANWDKLTTLEKMIQEREHRWYTLTPAGKLVWEMCVLAGLVQEYNASAEKVA